MSAFSVAVDIWSVGCIMGELLKGKVLFPGTDCILYQLSTLQLSSITLNLLILLRSALWLQTSCELASQSEGFLKGRVINPSLRGKGIDTEQQLKGSNRRAKFTDVCVLFCLECTLNFRRTGVLAVT